MAAQARIGNGVAIVKLWQNVAFVPPVVLLAGAIADVFLWRTHPFAALLGGTIGSAADPVVVAASLAVGLAMKPDWRALLAALMIGAVAELFNMNNALRAYEGTEGFNASFWLVRSLGSSCIIALVGGAKVGWSRIAAKRS